ncbi:P pilus assembly protein, pilin FimA [Salmonella enterica subsp. diarizonae]|nr:P pilus assembly protein, pilin FimA [Salmonella enterica subsp. diarizonae]
MVMTCAVFSGAAVADDTANDGTINVSDTVVEAPCVIAENSTDMSVDLGL